MPAPIPFKRDRMMRSDNYYSNQFRHDHQYLNAHVKIVQAKRTDTIESPKSRLEREMIEQFMKNNFRAPIAEGNFAFIAVIGKYIFLAIMLPPYIFLYGLPKWLFNQGEKATIQIVEMLQALILKMSTVGINIWSNIQAAIGKMFVRAPKKKARIEKVEKQSVRTSNMFDIMAGDILKHVKIAFHTAQSVAKWTSQHLAAAGKFVAGKINEVTTYLNVKMNQAFETVSAPVRTLLNKSKELIRAIPKPKLPELPKISFEPVRKAFELTSEKISSAYTAFIEKTVDVLRFIPFHFPLWVASKASEGTQSAAAMLLKKVQPIYNFGVAIVARTSEVVSKGTESLLKVMRSWMSRQAHRVEKVLQFTARVLVGIQKGLTNKISRLATKLSQTARYLKDQAKKRAKQAFEIVKTLPRKVAQIIAKTVTSTIHFLHRLIIAFIRVLVWMKILMQHGMKMLSEY